MNMPRRRFVEAAGLALAGTAAFPLSVAAGPRRARFRRETSDFGLWLWSGTDAAVSADDWRRRFGRLADGGFTGVFLGGEAGAAFDRAGSAAREHGLAVHRWWWTLNRPGDGYARKNHPEWFTVNREGASTLEHPPYVDYYRWVCPTRTPVREYLRHLVERMAADEGLDGIHLDYVRFCDVILPRALWEKYDLVQDRELPEFDYCYCDVCRESFAAQTGTDPLDLADPPSDERWRRFRWDAVTRLVGELAATAHARDMPMTAAVFPGPSVARRLVRQDWSRWPLDAVFPMLYQGFYEEDVDWIGDRVAEGVGLGVDGTWPGRGTTPEAADPPPGALFAGLYLPDLDPAGLGRAVRLAKRRGAAGASVFDLGALTDEHLAELSAAAKD